MSTHKTSAQARRYLRHISINKNNANESVRWHRLIFICLTRNEKQIDQVDTSNVK